MSFQVYTGVKCVRFRFTRELSEGILMGTGVLWLNALVWALTQLVAEATMEEGFLEPALHPHRLFDRSTGRRLFCFLFFYIFRGGVFFFFF